MTVTIPEKFEDIFEKDLLSEIEKKAEYKKVGSGETIVDYGQSAEKIPLIISGSVRITRTDEDGRELVLYYVNPNESCAMTFTCCMQNHPSEIRATAEDDVEMLVLPSYLMDEWLVKYPSWKNFVMKTIQDRFNELLKTIDQIAFQKLDERLIAYLREKSRVTGSALINLSHEQIANELATSRVVISRLLKKLEKDGRLLLYRNQIKLLKKL